MINIQLLLRLAVLKTCLLNKNNWLCFLSGFLLVFAYAPFSYWWLALFLPSVVLHQINLKSPAQAAKKIALFAFGWFASGISWVHVSIDQFGGLPLAISLLLMLMLCLYLALFPILATYLAAKLSKAKRLNLWLLPSCWLFGEYLRSEVLTGFPWLSLGYSQIDGPLAVFAPVIGEVGLTAIVLIINILVVYFFNALAHDNKAARAHLLKLPLILLSLIIVTQLTLQGISWVRVTGEVKTVALVQGNVEQSIKWQPEQEWPTMLKYLDLTRINYDADLIIWPESAIPAMEPNVQDYLSTVNKSALLNNSAIITGILNYNVETRDYFNSLIVLGKKNAPDQRGYYYNQSNRYDKNHLLPIGEFVPFQDWLRPLAPFFNLPMSSFSRGNYKQPNLIANSLVVLPLICFEIAFPHQLAANITGNTDVLLTVSNDAWFGDSHGPHQHFEIARMRALEFGRPLVRATNNGVSGLVDHLGRIIAIAPQFEEHVVKSELSLVTGQTPYSLWPRLILLIMILLPITLLKALLR